MKKTKDFKYYSELASCILLDDSFKNIRTRIRTSNSVLRLWKRTPIHSKELWKKLLIEYIQRIDIEKVIDFEEKYDIFLTKSINEKNISNIFRMPLRKVSEFKNSKNFKKDIYDLLMRQDKEILEFHINMLLYKFFYNGKI